VVCCLVLDIIAFYIACVKHINIMNMVFSKLIFLWHVVIRKPLCAKVDIIIILLLLNKYKKTRSLAAPIIYRSHYSIIYARTTWPVDHWSILRTTRLGGSCRWSIVLTAAVRQPGWAGMNVAWCCGQQYPKNEVDLRDWGAAWCGVSADASVTEEVHRQRASGPT